MACIMGYLIALLCASLLACKDLLSKRVSAHVSSTTSAFASFLFALPFYLLLLALLALLGREDFTLSSTFLLLVLCRSLTDTFAEWFKMSSFAHGELSVMVSLQSLSPLFLLLTSPMITGDKISTRGMLGVGLIVVATVLFVANPRGSAKKTELKGVIFALAAAFFFSLNTCFDRLAVQHASAAWSAFAMTLLAALFLAPLFWRARGGLGELRSQVRLFTARGAIEVVFMVSKLWALQYLQAQYVAALQRVSVLVAVINGQVFFDEDRFVVRMCAALLMLLGIVLILFG